ncbi:hypothetical protein ACTS9V_15575 [Empedobacter falsenii]
MKYFYVFAFLLFTFSCNNKEKELDNDISDLELEIKAREMTDSIIQNATKNKYLDSAGMENSPVIVLKSSFVKQDYSNYKDIELKYKNVSNKTITAIRFEWYGENAFGEPADMGGSFSKGTGGGFTDETLKPDKTGYGQWSILSNDGKKIKMARANEVAFSDGSTWKLNN